jgi:hypothetical protein
MPERTGRRYAMSASLEELASRKALLLARLRLERMQVALHAHDLRDAVRPAGLIGGAIAKPAATVALVEAIAPLFGLQRFAYWVRLGSIAFAVFGIARKWRRTDD